MTQDKTHLRTTFDQDALLYDQARPGYPEALFDDIVTLSAIPPNGRILEIGCGTGQATIPMARRGYHMLCIELGANLAALARRNLEAYPLVSTQTGAFEARRLEEEAFDLVLSATAFHWIDPAISYQKAVQALTCLNPHPAHGLGATSHGIPPAAHGIPPAAHGIPPAAHSA